MKSAEVALAVILSSLALLQTSSAQSSSSIVTQSFDRTAFLIQPNQRSASSAGYDGAFGLTPLFNIPGMVGFDSNQPAGTKCIYRISVETNVAMTSHEIFPAPCVSAIRFLIDKHAPTLRRALSDSELAREAWKECSRKPSTPLPPPIISLTIVQRPFLWLPW
jgi:hypothetical protein